MAKWAAELAEEGASLKINSRTVAVRTPATACGYIKECQKNLNAVLHGFVHIVIANDFPY